MPRSRTLTNLNDASTAKWAALGHAVIERAVDEWRQRLSACIRNFVLEADIFNTCGLKDDVM